MVNSKVFIVNIVCLSLSLCVCSYTTDIGEHAHTHDKERKREVQIEEGRRRMIRDRRKYEKWKLNRTERGNQVIYQ